MSMFVALCGEVGILDDCLSYPRPSAVEQFVKSRRPASSSSKPARTGLKRRQFVMQPVACQMALWKKATNEDDAHSGGLGLVE